MDSRLCWIWLQGALGCGSPLVSPLLSRFTPEDLYAADRAALTRAEIPAPALDALSDKSLERARGILWRALSDGDWLLTPADEAYPPLLRGIYSPPLVLYGRGTLPDFTRQPLVTVVGTRSLSRYGQKVTEMLSGDLARGGALVVSGGAVGADAVALTAALDAGGLTLSVQACGLDVNYPAANEDLRRRMLREEGTLLTEYSYGTRVGKGTFHVRNRLLSGLSHGVCVTEAPERSGALITARHAREQGRDVFAVPGDLTSPGSSGTNALIQNGARLIVDAGEILEEYRPLFPAMAPRAPLPPAAVPEPLRVAQPVASLPPAGVSEAALSVWQVLTDQPRPVDEVAAELSKPIPEVLAALTELELLGGAKSSAGQQYQRL